jgi:hypothetical protein
MKIAGVVAAFALLAFIVVAPLVAIGAYWHVRDASPFDSNMNRLYSQPTFPLDDDPATRPMAFDTVVAR